MIVVISLIVFSPHTGCFANGIIKNLHSETRLGHAHKFMFTFASLCYFNVQKTSQKIYDDTKLIEFTCLVILKCVRTFFINIQSKDCCFTSTPIKRLFFTLWANQRRPLLRNLSGLSPSQFYTKKGRAEIIKMNNSAVLDLVLLCKKFRG